MKHWCFVKKWLIAFSANFPWALEFIFYAEKRGGKFSWDVYKLLSWIRKQARMININERRMSPLEESTELLWVHKQCKWENRNKENIHVKDSLSPFHVGNELQFAWRFLMSIFGGGKDQYFQGFLQSSNIVYYRLWRQKRNSNLMNLFAFQNHYLISFQHNKMINCFI